MVRHDLRTNTSARWYAPVPPPPPLTNKDLHKLSCAVSLHGSDDFEMLDASLSFSKRRKGSKACSPEYRIKCFFFSFLEAVDKKVLKSGNRFVDVYYSIGSHFVKSVLK